MTEGQPDYGWFNYGRELDRQRHVMGVDLPLPRRADDPPLVIWQQDDTSWVVDDEDRDGYWHIHGFTREPIIGAIRFAWAMGWLAWDRTRPALFRRIDDPDQRIAIT
jgi:hypothetical protein